MFSPVLVAAVLLACALPFSAAQTSCRGRCGTDYYRGYTCQCDYSCLVYGECCKDYESHCTTKNSCKGRCGETFKRGRLCSCDPDCIKYKQCCPDYKIHCDEEEVNGADSVAPPVMTNCENTDDNKPKENKATEQPIESPLTFSEGNDLDDNLIPLISPTSYPQDNLSKDQNQNIPNVDSSNDDPELSPVTESTSGYGSTPADPMDPFSTKPTFTVPPQLQMTEVTQTDSETSTRYASAEVPSENTAPGTDDPDRVSHPTIPGSTVPRTFTEPDPASSQPMTTPELQTDLVSTASTPGLQTTKSFEMLSNDSFTETPSTDPADDPEIMSLDPEKTDINQEVNPTTASYPVWSEGSTYPTQDSSTAQESTEPYTQLSTTPASSTLDQTTIPERSPSTPDNFQDLSTTVSPSGSLTDGDTLTTHVPSVTHSVQTAIDDIAPGEPTADSTATLVPTSSDLTSKPADQLNPFKPGEPTADSTATLVPTSSDLPSKPADQLNPFKPGEPTADSTATLTPTSSDLTSKPADQPDPYKPLPDKPALTKPTSKPESKPSVPVDTPNLDDQRDYQSDDSNDTNLCSGRPVGAVTTLRNGTMVVFRGHFFWILDRNRVPSPARGITEAWGVPSPIDTVFTRCNCQGKTYIFKGPRYWRFDNDVLDPGYPKVVETGFDGLRGHITAALSVPQFERRRESVYFFKRGGTVQKYSYQFNPSCGRRLNYAIYTTRNRFVRQAVSHLGPVINMSTSWKGFPTTITAAVSIPSTSEREGYSYFVFSRSKSYRVRMDGERPVQATPNGNTSPQRNDFFKCTNKV